MAYHEDSFFQNSVLYGYHDSGDEQPKVLSNGDQLSVENMMKSIDMKRWEERAAAVFSSNFKLDDNINPCREVTVLQKSVVNAMADLANEIKLTGNYGDHEVGDVVDICDYFDGLTCCRWWVVDNIIADPKISTSGLRKIYTLLPREPRVTSKETDPTAIALGLVDKWCHLSRATTGHVIDVHIGIYDGGDGNSVRSIFKGDDQRATNALSKYLHGIYSDEVMDAIREIIWSPDVPMPSEHEGVKGILIGYSWYGDEHDPIHLSIANVNDARDRLIFSAGDRVDVNLHTLVRVECDDTPGITGDWEVCVVDWTLATNLTTYTLMPMYDPLKKAMTTTLDMSDWNFRKSGAFTGKVLWNRVQNGISRYTENYDGKPDPLLVYSTETGETVPDVFQIGDDHVWQHIRGMGGELERDGPELRARRVSGEFLVGWNEKEIFKSIAEWVKTKEDGGDWLNRRFPWEHGERFIEAPIFNTEVDVNETVPDWVHNLDRRL